MVLNASKNEINAENMFRESYHQRYANDRQKRNKQNGSECKEEDKSKWRKGILKVF